MYQPWFTCFGQGETAGLSCPNDREISLPVGKFHNNIFLILHKNIMKYWLFIQWNALYINNFSLYHIVGNQRVILIDSLFHHSWVHHVTFACFQSNMHDLCDLFLPNEITCYVCVLLFCFGGALFKPTCLSRYVLFYSYYIFLMTEIHVVPVSVLIVYYD